MSADRNCNWNAANQRLSLLNCDPITGEPTTFRQDLRYTAAMQRTLYAVDSRRERLRLTDALVAATLPSPPEFAKSRAAGAA